MELSPRSSRRIQESTGSSSSELQPFINLDDSSFLHVQDGISAREQRQLLRDCEKEQISLQNEIRALQQFVDDSGKRLQKLDDDTSMNTKQLTTCLEGIEKKEMEKNILESVVEHMTEHLERVETLDRLQREKMEKFSEQMATIAEEQALINIRIKRVDHEAKALAEEIENLEMQLIEESDCFVSDEKSTASPASEINQSPSASDKGNST